MTAKRILAAVLIALGLAAGAGAVAASGTGTPVASAPQTFYRG
jgi:ABC-type sugar transport system substrate-binding protein